MAKNKWALVVVAEWPSRTRPIVVNVYGYPTKKEAESHQRKTKKAAKDFQGKVIAVRVRPIIDDEFLEEETRKINEH